MTGKEYSEIDVFDGVTYPDGDGEREAFGGVIRYDSRGRVIESGKPGALGTYVHADGESCYVATCVYGSEDSAVVWTLRRFRGEVLGVRISARLLLRFHHAVMPTVVRLLGKYKAFRRGRSCAAARFSPACAEGAPHDDKIRRNIRF